MGKKDKRWVLQRKKDPYYNLAKRKNYRSRATYKLFQLNEKFNIIKEKNVVVDLGCAPGGWLQAARDMTGEEGFIVGIDLQQIKPLPYENVIAVKGDMTDEETLKKIQDILPEKPDVIICDASPNISGVWDVDHTRSLELTTMALMTATKMLKKGGNFVVKVFQGDLFYKYVELVSEYFDKAFTTKPRASREESAEVYVIAKHYNGKKFNMKSKSDIVKLLKPQDELKREESALSLRKNISDEDTGMIIKKIKQLRAKKD
ncbi:ribosomal RNA methyltransferase RrmJ/FtsJ [Methanococcus vannielii SB]|jgi:23S rRNA (uridine2552-2'-O)-methyltransferase|uniref:Ribosomal RNA large subunit methyltransferase E n=1 Tax=Methanococcus vannielii (strain ATCC 35089 / DSM 1224 / JCM 13029 / OCM 148 / SB) TaxID=406327 RepID=RLME_METVS|nr:RlmE family RNA methyltransferase [Methanococcus vannielii]A6USA0.1 RecName: Full=Ribosomal RNA large subunit methyltransferase E; AltName: Full=23S rRNA Um2552 methyltransferase; AltName: Full=rRNA (uridine-2'-O-)-methyltransferase [Methanococcus vannielii SB]ABR55372.1 ribosomal RNA methyltransferase RrmJ/FtsJ [Methanococcus vannielii SB]